MDCLSVKTTFTEAVRIDNCVLWKPATKQQRSMGFGYPQVSLENVDDDDTTNVSTTTNNVSIDYAREVLPKANNNLTRKAQEEECEFNRTIGWKNSTNNTVEGYDERSMQQTTKSFHSIHENYSTKPQQDVTLWNAVCTRMFTQRRSSIGKRLSTSEENLHIDDTFSCSNESDPESETFNETSDGFVKITDVERLKLDKDTMKVKKIVKNRRVEGQISKNDMQKPATVVRKSWVTIPFRRIAATSTLSVPHTSKLC